MLFQYTITDLYARGYSRTQEVHDPHTMDPQELEAMKEGLTEEAIKEAAALSSIGVLSGSYVIVTVLNGEVSAIHSSDL